MTAAKAFYATRKPLPRARARRASLAGQLLAACVEVDEPFEADLHGWRVVVDKVTEHRAMVADDLGLSEVAS